MKARDSIRFRGKMDSRNEWVYGSYVRGGVLDYIYNSFDKMIHVIPETVGQYIGRSDKNNKDVYVGDFITAYDGRVRGPVVFDRRGAMYGVPIGPNELYPFSASLLESKDIEVIGNIHDNPDLMATLTAEQASYFG